MRSHAWTARAAAIGLSIAVAVLLAVAAGSAGAVAVDAAGSGTASAGATDDQDDAGEVVALDHPDTVAPGGTFQVTVETAAAAGTVVELTGEDVDLEVDSDAAVRVDDGHAEFLDPFAGDSEYVVSVDVGNASGGEAVDVAAWVNGDDMASADDAASGVVTVEDGGSGDDRGGRSDAGGSDAGAGQSDDAGADDSDETATSDGTDGDGSGGDRTPGFGVLATVAALSAAAALVRRVDADR